MAELVVPAYLAADNPRGQSGYGGDEARWKHARGLLVGVFNEERKARATEALVAGWGFEVTGRAERPHRDERLAYRAFWLDAAGG